jgi:hypothetical protein
LHEDVELFERHPHLLGDLFFGRRAAVLDLERLVRALELAGALANRARDPVERAQRVEDRTVDAGDRVGFELYAARVVVLLDRVDEPEDAVVDQVVDLDVGRQVDRNPPGHVLDQVQILVDDLFATELDSADDVVRARPECFHRLLLRRDARPDFPGRSRKAG